MAWSCFSVRGEGLALALDALVTCRVATMRAGDTRSGFLLDARGKVIDSMALRRPAAAAQPAGDDVFIIGCHERDIVTAWLRAAFSGASLDEALPEARLKCDASVDVAPQDAVGEFKAVSLESPEGAGLVDITKPFFVGRRAIEARFPARSLPRWNPLHIERPKLLPKTLLGAEHERIGVSQWGPFGSCTMPIQYAAGPPAIAGEHLATRCSAALYDVSHMLPIIVKGRDARAFLEMCLVNSVARLRPGRCQYTAICAPDGAPMDDLYLNHFASDAAKGEDVFLLVGNSGHELDYHYLKAVASGAIAIDPAAPAKRFEGEVELVSRLEPHHARGRWSEPLYSVSLQGPKSLDVLLAALTAESRPAVQALKFNRLAAGVTLASGGDAVVTHTGYCGEPVGFEIYTTAASLVPLWRAISAGGAAPAGLGARDSTRQEAGLPLFGHEIDGPLDVPLTGGRYPKIVDFAKPFFLGRGGALAAERNRTKRVFLLAGEGPRKVSQGWPVYARDGALLGHVTSTSTIRPGKTDVTQAYLEQSRVKVGDSVVIASPSRPPKAGEPPEGRAFTVATWDKARDYSC